MNARLFYLMGPSGAGKDALLRHCRQRLVDIPCLVAHRYITRPPELEGENHIWLPDSEFDARARLGAFAMHWQAHGHRYGIGQEVNHWLDAGTHVLVNGSRAYLNQALALYRERLIPLVLQVDPNVLHQRLLARGRETPSEIAARVERARALARQLPEGTLGLDNNQPLDETVENLTQLIHQHTRRREALA